MVSSSSYENAYENVEITHLGSHRGDVAKLTRRAFLALIPLSYVALKTGPAFAAEASVLNFVAHQDDDLLFLSPDLLHAIQAGGNVRTVYLTAGDDGQQASYWQSRERGVQAAYAEMTGAANTWTQSDAGVPGHPIPVLTLTGQPNVSLAFMRLPDGNLDGSGFAATGNQSLQALWTGSITTIDAVDGSASYTLPTLTSTLASLMSSFQPSRVNTQDYVGSYGDGDHSDHYTAAYLTRSAVAHYNASAALTGYEGYPIEDRAANVSATDQTAKQNAFFAYAQYDDQVCSSLSACTNTPYVVWLARQYTVGQASDVPVADAGAAQSVSQGVTVTLDGSGSADPDGGALTYQWTQTAGMAVTLSSATAVQPTFPASAVGTLAFQLVVTNAQGVSSAPATVSVTVVDPTANLALSATATASSQNTSTGQTANKAIDGVIGGYPGTYTVEWATDGGGAGSWLRLTWPAAQTFDTIVLYDRPNLDDQITGGNITFSDGTSIPVCTLPNNGSAYTLSFPAKTATTLQLNITSVSSTTLNIGLAEIQVYNGLAVHEYSR